MCNFRLFTDKRLWSERIKAFWLPLIMAAFAGFLASSLNIPGSWLIGAMLVTIIYTLLGQKVDFPNQLRDVLFVGLGLVFGSRMTPDALNNLENWPLSMVLVLINVAVVVGASMTYLTLVAKWNKATALLGSIPGALSHILSVAEDAGADLTKVAISQSTRIFLLAGMIPFALDNRATAPESAPIVPISLIDLSIVIVVGGIGAAFFKLLRIPGALITGATFASAILFSNGLVEGSFQPPYLALGFILLGMMIGSRLSGVSVNDARKYLIISIGGFVLVFSLSAAGAAMTAKITGISFGLALLAFAPGAFEAMTVLAVFLDLDPAFVIAHHMVRYFAIIVMTPVFLLLLSGKTKNQ